MSKGINAVTLFGNLGQNPELRYTQSQQAVLSFRMATAESYKDKDGEWKEKSEWHSVVVWGKRAEALNKLLHKGKQVLVTGRLQTRSWEAKEGGKRYATEIVANEVILAGGRGDAAGSSDYDNSSEPPVGAGHDSSDDDSIPF